jgi:hypothetical protein
MNNVTSVRNILKNNTTFLGDLVNDLHGRLWFIHNDILVSVFMQGMDNDDACLDFEIVGNVCNCNVVFDSFNNRVFVNSEALTERSTVTQDDVRSVGVFVDQFFPKNWDVSVDLW